MPINPKPKRRKRYNPPVLDPGMIRRCRHCGQGYVPGCTECSACTTRCGCECVPCASCKTRHSRRGLCRTCRKCRRTGTDQCQCRTRPKAQVVPYLPPQTAKRYLRSMGIAYSSDPARPFLERAIGTELE